jgi:protein phosphatase
MLLLCSDGLSGKLRSEDIQNIVASNPDLTRACDELIAEANNRGGEDNITVILARFSGNELEDPASDRITIELPAMEEEDKTLDDTYDTDTEPH